MKEKDFYSRAKELVDECLFVKDNNVYETLAKEFGIGKRTAGDRFKSMFGMPVRDYIGKNTIPTKEEMIDLIVKYDNSEDAFKNSNIRYSGLWSKYLHKYFKTNNFLKIKATLHYRMTIPELTPRREDNESIIISQILGDGHVERGHTLKLEHSEKQYEYLKFKIALLNNAYPKVNGLDKVRKRTQDFKGKELVSYVYRTGAHLKYAIDKIDKMTMKEKVFAMTPLGMMLLYFDDDSFSQSITNDSMSKDVQISTINEELQDALVEYLESYGIRSNKLKHGVHIQASMEVIKFFQNFILPYKHIIPKNMHYKFHYKDIVEM